MLSSVEVRTVQGTLLTLTLQDVSSGLVIEDITGLDPVKATIVSSNFANLDGAQYQSSRLEPRNIVMKIGFEPDYASQSIQTLRRQLYSFFMPESQVTLRFIMSDASAFDIQARIESFEAPLFAKDPEAIISFMCLEPSFFDATPVVISGSTVSTTTETLLSYPGTIGTGLLFTLNVNRNVSNVDIYHRPPDGIMRTMYIAESLVTSDVVRVNTAQGNKYATLQRASSLLPFVYALSPQSAWFEIMPGDNYFRVYAAGAAIPYTLTYTKRYGGL